MRRASHSREAELVPLTTSFASTGSATGRVQHGSLTITASTTQLFPRPVLCCPCADPSWNQDAAQTFFPRRRNKVSSIATVTGQAAGTSSATASLAAARPRSSGFQRAREKNQCARSWLHSRASPAPDSIPHTVRFPVCATNPQASMVNVRKDGAVNIGANPVSSVSSDAGTGSVASGSIGGIPFQQRSDQHRRCSPLHPPHLPHRHVRPAHPACRRYPGCAQHPAMQHAGTAPAPPAAISIASPQRAPGRYPATAASISITSAKPLRHAATASVAAVTARSHAATSPAGSPPRYSSGRTADASSAANISSPSPAPGQPGSSPAITPITASAAAVSSSRLSRCWSTMPGRDAASSRSSAATSVTGSENRRDFPRRRAHDGGHVPHSQSAITSA